MKSITPIINFLSANWKSVLFASLMLRIIICGANLSESLIILSFLAYWSCDKYMEEKRAPDLNKDVVEQLNRLKDKVSQLTLGSVYKK